MMQATDTDYKYNVRLFYNEFKLLPKFNEICIWAIETYGCPGKRFITHPHENYMDFIFKEKKDAIHFSLRWE